MKIVVYALRQLDGYLPLCRTCLAHQLDYFPAEPVCVNKVKVFLPSEQTVGHF